MISATRYVGMYLSTPQSLGVDLFPNRSLYQWRSTKERIGKGFYHRRLIGHENNIGTTGSITTSAQGDLFQPHGRHAGHVVEHGAKVTIVRENISLHG